jgi:hypothetical protein
MGIRPTNSKNLDVMTIVRLSTKIKITIYSMDISSVDLSKHSNVGKPKIWHALKKALGMYLIAKES